MEFGILSYYFRWLKIVFYSFLLFEGTENWFLTRFLSCTLSSVSLEAVLSYARTNIVVLFGRRLFANMRWHVISVSVCIYILCARARACVRAYITSLAVCIYNLSVCARAYDLLSVNRLLKKWDFLAWAILKCSLPFHASIVLKSIISLLEEW